MSKVLILGGTSQGNALARRIAEIHSSVNVVSSFSGATKSTPDIPGEIRVGGFGGTSGLVDYVKNNGVDVLIDVTHPFASTITDHAITACAQASIPYLYFERPAWVMPDNCEVIFAADAKAAAKIVAEQSRRVFLTIGRKDVAAFSSLKDVKLWVRSIVPPEENLAHATVILARPPFSLDAEISFLREHQIDTLVTKDSGGDATRAKLDACAQLRVRIVVLRRPPSPDGERVQHIDAAINWLTKTLSLRAEHGNG